MEAELLDGVALSKKMREEIRCAVERLSADCGVVPGLGVILVGENPASMSYVKAKEKACADVGIKSKDIRLPATVSEADLINEIEKLNRDSEIHGILVQLPLPKGFDELKVINAIIPEKDVDGFTVMNVGRMMLDLPCFLPCTPAGIIEMLRYANVKTTGKHVVVVGRSNIVGRPISYLLSKKAEPGNATVTMCHTGTVNLAEFTKAADILVVASGHQNTVTGDMVKTGAVVIDVGVNRIPSAEAERGYKLCGDCDFNALKNVASLITPVPGGVGPMTITMLLKNTLESARRTVHVQNPQEK